MTIAQLLMMRRMLLGMLSLIEAVLRERGALRDCEPRG